MVLIIFLPDFTFFNSVIGFLIIRFFKSRDARKSGVTNYK
jgi:hypothetical protein